MSKSSPLSTRVLEPSRDHAATPAVDHEREVLEAIRNTAFGTIEITVHQSRIVQITRSEKLRFDSR